MNTRSLCSSGLLRSVLMGGVLLFVLSFTSIASAAGGCGFGMHRGPWGGCQVNAPGPYATPAPYHPGCWRNGWGRLRCYR